MLFVMACFLACSFFSSGWLTFVPVNVNLSFFLHPELSLLSAYYMLGILIHRIWLFCQILTAALRKRSSSRYHRGPYSIKHTCFMPEQHCGTRTETLALMCLTSTLYCLLLPVWSQRMQYLCRSFQSTGELDNTNKMRQL